MKRQFGEQRKEIMMTHLSVDFVCRLQFQFIPIVGFIVSHVLERLKTGLKKQMKHAKQMK